MKFPNKRIVFGATLVLVAALAATGLKATSAHPQPVKAAKSVMSVTTLVPVEKRWPVQLAASGSIVAWQEAVIGAETGGLRITALYADVGSRVKRGQLLAELARDSVQAEVRRYQAALASARASLAQAKANADRARQVRGSGAISEQQVNDYLATELTAQAAVDLAEAQLSSQKVTLSQTRIVAVDDGIVTSRSVLLGQVVSAGTELFRLQRQGRLEWQAELDAQQLGLVRQGARSQITLPSGQQARGTVRLAAPTLSTSTSRANVFVTLPAGSGAKAGMFASGQIEAGLQQVLTVPESALVLRDGHGYLFEAGGDGKVVRRTVSTGMHRDGLVALHSGLSAGARVVKSGGAFLADGDPVTQTEEPRP